MDFNIPSVPVVGPHIPDMTKQIEEMSRAVEEGKQDFINRIAEAAGSELAKALRKSPILFDEIVGALSSLCGNRHYNSSTDEDTMNDYVRDVLGQGLQIRDQTRQGISENSRSAERGQAGEIDIQIRNNGKPIGIYEALRLDGVHSNKIYEHIEKATVKYNPQGVKEVFVVAYVQKQSKSFGGFWNRFVECVKGFEAEFDECQIKWDDEEEDTGLSAVRSIHGTYMMNDAEHNVHVMAVKIME